MNVLFLACCLIIKVKIPTGGKIVAEVFIIIEVPFFAAGIGQRTIAARIDYIATTTGSILPFGDDAKVVFNLERNLSAGWSYIAFLFHTFFFIITLLYHYVIGQCDGLDCPFLPLHLIILYIGVSCIFYFSGPCQTADFWITDG